MGTVDVRIDHNSTNLSGYVISYERVSDLCSGVGTITVTVDPDTPRTFLPGDVIELYEDSNKVGKYYIGGTFNSPNEGLILECQDTSKWLEAYFVFKSYPTQGLSARYWIGFILNLAGISYSFNTDETGYNLNPVQSLGFESAYEIIMRLCQQSGWYFYFNSTGSCVIGTLSSNWHNPSITIKTSAGNVIDEFIDADDDSLRNRVVVYGGNGINTELTVSTAWDRNANDKRSVVYSNGYIQDEGTAISLGSTILKEWSKTVAVKVYTVVGYISANVGETAYCRTNVFNGIGRITKITSRTTKDGFVSEVILDTRCPRLVGYWRIDNEYVYAGTSKNGVYRKPLDGNTWTSYNTGLTNLNIRDLKVRNGILVATTNTEEVFRRAVAETSWEQITPTEVSYTTIGGELVTLPTSGFVSAGCGITFEDSKIYVGYNFPSSGTAYVMELSPDDTYLLTPVQAEGNRTLELLDTDTDDINTFVVLNEAGGQSDVEAKWISDGLQMEANTAIQGLYGTFNFYQRDQSSPDNISLISKVAGYGVDDPIPATYIDGLGRGARVVDNKIYYVVLTTLYVRDLDNPFSYTTYFLSGLSSDTTAPMVIYVEDNKDVIHFWVKKSGSADGTHYYYTISTTTLTFVSDYSQFGSAYYGVGKYVFSATVDTSDVGGNIARRVVLYYYDFEAETMNSITSANMIAGTYSSSTHTIVDQPVAQGFHINHTETGCYAMSTANFVIRRNSDSHNFGELNLGVAYYDIYLGGSSFVNNWYEHDEPLTGDTITVGEPSVDFMGINKGLGYLYMHVTGSMNVAGVDDWNTRLGLIYQFPTNTIVRSFDDSYDPNIGVPSTLSHWAGVGSNLTKRVVSSRQGAHAWHWSESTGSPLLVVENVATGSKHTFNPTSVSYPTVPPIKVFSELDEFDNSIGFYNTSTSDFDWYDFTTETKTRIMDNVPGATYEYFHLYTRYFTAGRAGSYETRLYRISGVLEFPEGEGTLKAARNYTIATTSGDTYEIIGTFTTTSGYMYLDIPQSTPPLFFGGAVISGLLGTPELKLTHTGEPNSLKNVTVVSSDNVVTDVRAAPFIDLEPGVFDSYLFMPASGGVYYKTYTPYSGGWSLVTPMSGIFHKVETGNLQQYIFTSTSGAPSRFYQQDPFESFFTEYSDGLPSSNITVIRLDDRI